MNTSRQTTNTRYALYTLFVAFLTLLLAAPAFAKHHRHPRRHRKSAQQIVITTAPAHAPASGNADDLQRALKIAEAAWGGAPCGGQFKFTIDPTLPGNLEGLASVTPDSSGGVSDCHASVKPNPSWLVFCSSVVHEMGHLHQFYDPVGYTWPDGHVDHQHSPDPTSIMYPILHTFAGCR